MPEGVNFIRNGKCKVGLPEHALKNKEISQYSWCRDRIKPLKQKDSLMDTNRYDEAEIAPIGNLDSLPQ